MNKKMREIKAQMDVLNEEATVAFEAKDLEKAESKIAEIENLEREYKVAEKLFNGEKEEVTDEVVDKANDVKNTKTFAKAIKNLVTNQLNETTPTAGGYTVPEEIITKVQKFIENEESLINEVTVKNVNTNKGSETFKTRGQYTGFGSIEEGGKIPKAGSPKFQRINWAVTKYGGYMPVTNELLEDSDAEVEQMMIEWLGNESRVTRNNLIMAVVNKKAETDLKNLDGIKKALNVTLGSKFKSISKIITNDDGLQYLDTLKDQNGRDLLQPMPNEPTKLQLRAGASVIPVKVYSNETIPTKAGGKIPFIIGSLKEGVKLYNRKGLTLLTSKTAVVGEGEDALNAYEEDLTLIRGIERLDVEERDAAAFVNGYITVTEQASA